MGCRIFVSCTPAQISSILVPKHWCASKGVHSDTDVFVLLQKTRHIGRSGEDKRRLRKRKRASPACVRLNTHQKKNFVGQAGIILLMQSRGGVCTCLSVCHCAAHSTHTATSYKHAHILLFHLPSDNVQHLYRSYHSHIHQKKN